MTGRDGLNHKIREKDGTRTKHCREMHTPNVRLREPCERRGDPDFDIYFYTFMQIMMTRKGTLDRRAHAREDVPREGLGSRG